MGDLVSLNGAAVVIGGKSGLAPNINSGRWTDEAWLNLNYAAMLSPTAVYAPDKSVLQKGGEQFHMWPFGDAVLEAAVVFAARPAKAEIRLRMAHSGLQFWPQPLVLGADTTAPERVLGSIAVYHTKMHNQYQAGKLAHLYRWECIAANGSRAWCDPLRVAGEDLVIGLPVDWLSKAAYPVTAMGAGDTFGYSTVGGSDANYLTSYNAAGQLHDTLVAAA